MHWRDHPIRSSTHTNMIALNKGLGRISHSSPPVSHGSYTAKQPAATLGQQSLAASWIVHDEFSSITPIVHIVKVRCPIWEFGIVQLRTTRALLFQSVHSSTSTIVTLVVFSYLTYQQVLVGRRNLYSQRISSVAADSTEWSVTSQRYLSKRWIAWHLLHITKALLGLILRAVHSCFSSPHLIQIHSIMVWDSARWTKSVSRLTFKEWRQGVLVHVLMFYNWYPEGSNFKSHMCWDFTRWTSE